MNLAWLSRKHNHSAQALTPAQHDTLTRWSLLPEPDLGRAHRDTRYVVLNTEATGLDIDRDRLIAVGAIVIEDLRIHPRACYYASLADDPNQALTGLLDFIGKSPLIVYGAHFHRTLLERSLQPLELEAMPTHWHDLYWLLPALFQRAFSGPSRLATWMDAFGIETFQRHHALGDAWAMAQLTLPLLHTATNHSAATPRQLIDLERTRRQFVEGR